MTREEIAEICRKAREKMERPRTLNQSDLDKLLEEFMARYSKTLAYLAKH